MVYVWERIAGAGVDPVKYWTTKSGTRTPIGKMGDRHLLNTVLMLERDLYGTEHPAYLDLLEEVNKRFLLIKLNDERRDRARRDRQQPVMSETPIIWMDPPARPAGFVAPQAQAKQEEAPKPFNPPRMKIERD